jgi:hypothetical protein
MVTNVTDAAYRQNVMPPIALFLPSEAVLVPAEGLWWFEQSGVAPPPTWTTIGYDDSDWSSSNALFVAKRGIPGNGDLPIQTMLSLSNNAAGSPTQTITYYFRTYFTMPTAAALAGVQSYRFQVHPILDDGAAFYINGQLARRVRLTNEVITYDSLAQGPAQGTDYRFEGPYDLPTTNVLFGRINVLAVEVHQQVADSSDIAFAAELLIQVPALQMRLVVSTDASGNLVLTWPPVPGYTLYQANNLSGPYTPVPGNPSGAYTVPTPLAPNQFYRLQNP